VITGARGDFAGIPIVVSSMLPDGEVLIVGQSSYSGTAAVFGAGPIGNSEWCRREALRIVRTGLADVLEWLGEPPWTPPLGSVQILARMKVQP
jgi:hypothetical protein